MGLLAHSNLNDKPPTTRALNILVKNGCCLVGIVTGLCKKLSCGFNQKLETAPEAISTLCQIIDDGAKALTLA